MTKRRRRENLPENVSLLGTVTRKAIPPDRVLDNAPEDMKSVVVVGYTKEGEFFIASSDADGAEVLWLLSHAQYKLHDIIEYGQ